MATTSELLALVDQAIETVLKKGQAFTVQGRTYTRADLAELRRWRKELIAETVQTERGGIRVRYGVPRR